MISNKEILIVGQGIAGTLLAYFLLKKNQPIKVIDLPLPGSSSGVAAGIINPVTGRRMVKSWRFEELITFAQSTYEDIGQLLGVSVFQEKNILRALPNIFEENEWERRSGFPENRSFFCESADLGNYMQAIKPAHSWGELAGAAKVDMHLLSSTFKQYLIGKSLFQEDLFDFKELKSQGDEVSYRDVFYDKIIFCEGAKAINNPYFNYLPFSTTKGELLMVKIKGLKVEKMLKNKIYLVPLHDDVFWVGSSNSFDFNGVQPTDEMYDYLKTALDETLDVPYEIQSHKAGIRPTIKDKRPLLGLHPLHRTLGIFNGLGTKGASLGPFFAEQMASHLLEESPLDEEVNIERFKKQ